MENFHQTKLWWTVIWVWLLFKCFWATAISCECSSRRAPKHVHTWDELFAPRENRSCLLCIRPMAQMLAGSAMGTRSQERRSCRIQRRGEGRRGGSKRSNGSWRSWAGAKRWLWVQSSYVRSHTTKHMLKFTQVLTSTQRLCCAL